MKKSFKIFLLYFSFIFILFADETDEFYILPDFVVTDAGDKGYYSANTLAGTKTNELVKNIPITVSTVNEEMLKDYEMSSLSELGKYVPSIESGGSLYNNQEIRFRGFLTRSQLYEFMPRYSPVNYYNIQRADVVRGANSLIYGQSDPGGKVNLISKTASASKDLVKIISSFSNNDSQKVIFDGNKVLSDNLSVRLLGINQKRNYDQNFRFYEYDGFTLETLYRVNNNTRLRLHLENGSVERSLIGGTFKVGSGSTGLPLGIVADPKLADLLEEPFYQYILNYNDGNLRTNTPGLINWGSGNNADIPTTSRGPLITDYITSRQDISDMFSAINYTNTGIGNGPDSYYKQDFNYNFAELMHVASDNLEIKASIGVENLDGEILNGGYSANHLRNSLRHGKGQNIPNVPGNTTYDDAYELFHGRVSAVNDESQNITLIASPNLSGSPTSIGETLRFEERELDPLNFEHYSINIDVNEFKAFISNSDETNIKNEIRNSLLDNSANYLFNANSNINKPEGSYEGVVFNNQVPSFTTSEREKVVEIMADKFYDALSADISSMSNSNFWIQTREIKNLIKYVLNKDNVGNNAIWDRFVLPALLEASSEDLDGNGEPDYNVLTSSEINSLGEINPSTSPFANDVNDQIVIRKWKKETKTDDNISFRGTINYTPKETIFPGRQSFLLGLDLDKRDASVTTYEEYLGTSRDYGNGITLNADQADQYLLLQQLLEDSLGNSYSLLDDRDLQGHDLTDSNFGSDARGVASALASNYMISLDPNIERVIRVSERFSTTVKTSGIWLASSGSYNDGKLRTLLGGRIDRIDVEGNYFDYKRSSLSYDNDINSSTYGEVLGMLPKTGDPNDTSLIENHFSPSLGALYWFNKNTSIFANFSKSIISPTGFQYDVMGKLTPPETGNGKEFGFKFSNQESTINAQLAFFRIDKKNDQKSNLSYPQLQAIYPFENEQFDANGNVISSELYPYSDIIYSAYTEVRNDDGDIIDYTGAVFDPIGTRVANEETRSEGIELDLYYNPTRAVSVFLGYAYLDTTYLKSIIPSLEGLTIPGTSNHNFNAQLKYTFTSGKYKGFFCGLNYKYRSAALLNNYFTDINDDRESDYYPEELDGDTVVNPSYFEFKLEDQFSTDAFVGWGGKISKQKGSPSLRIQLNINNVFDDIHLISTGSNNARYTDSRNVTLSSTISF
jgi:outer membrane receptor protein involved in Fe transport